MPTSAAPPSCEQTSESLRAKLIGTQFAAHVLQLRVVISFSKSLLFLVMATQFPLIFSLFSLVILLFDFHHQSTIQYSTIQYNTIQYNTIQYIVHLSSFRAYIDLLINLLALCTHYQSFFPFLTFIT